MEILKNGVYIFVNMAFKENGDKYFRQMPAWVECMIRFGYRWTNDGNETPARKRRLALISMPCKSVAAELVALGVLRRELEYGQVSNFDRLVNGIKYFQNITEDITLVDQHGKKWRFSKINSNRSISVYDAKYRQYVKIKGKTVPNPNGIVTSMILEQYLSGWRIDGLPPVLTSESIDSHFYNDIAGCTGLIEENNLQTSSEQTLLLSDSVSISTVSRRELDDVWFSLNERQASLSELLTLNESKDKIQRLVFSSLRSIGNSSFTRTPGQIIADGSHSFLLALDRFRDSDVVGVISRDEPPANIDSIFNKINELSRYYRKVNSLEQSVVKDHFPLSIAVLFMERR